MKRVTIALIAAAGVLAGCGGELSSAAPLIYTGQWSGEWASAGAGTTGTLSLNINADGTVNGSMLRRVDNQTGTIATTITNSGDLSSLVDFTGLDYQLSGTVVRQGANTLRVTFSFTFDGSNYSGSATLVRS